MNGKIYAVPSYKDSSMTNYFVWDKDLLDANSIDTTEMHDLAAVEETLYALKDLVSIAPFTTNGNGNGFILANYDSLSSGLPALGVRVDDESRQVVAVFEQEDIMETLTMFHKWFNDGIINADAAVLAEVPSYRPFYVAQGWPYAAVSTWGPSMGVNAIAVQLGDTILSNSTVQGSLNSISINCEHPDKALEFLNLINTDSYVRDLFAYGEEGVDWEYTEEGLITRHNPAWDIPAYTQGTFFNLTQETEYNQYEEEVRPLNDNAVPSVMLGFFFDTTNVQDQLASCIEIYNRYKNEVLTGTTDPATSVPQMMEEMRAAGFDEIVAEAQTQIDAWVELTATDTAAEEPAAEAEEPAAETEEPAAE